MRRGTVNILRRTCGRNGNNFFAASRRRTSASAISRFTRLLSCPCGRLRRHLFDFFFFFFFPAEKPGVLSLFSLAGGSALGLGPPVARWLRGFHPKNNPCRYLVMQLGRDRVFAGISDRPLKYNLRP